MVIWAVRALLPLATLVIFAGTATTAAGPHSGGATGQHIKRLHCARVSFNASRCAS
jgi:hypothetical protein